MPGQVHVGPRPSESSLDQQLLELGFRRTTVSHMAHRQKYAIVREYEAREAKRVAAQVQLILNLET